MSRGKLQQNMNSRGETLGRCESGAKSEDVEIIDLDSGDADVVIIDAPGPSCHRTKFVRKEKTASPNCVISIDDDDEEESGTDSHSGASGSHSSIPRNRYGLDFASDTESFATGTSGSKDSTGAETSDGEGSDCEILDDSSGIIRQEWERAHSKKAVPPDRVGSNFRENVRCQLNKSFEDNFNDCFGESSSLRNKFGFHKDGAACSVPNANSSGDLSKEKVPTKCQPWYEKDYGSFVPGAHQDEIRERVSPFFGIRPCSYRKGKSVLSDNGVRSSEKKSVREEVVQEHDNGVRSPKKMAENEIIEETDNCGRSFEKMSVEEVNLKEASSDLVTEMNDKMEKGEPSRDVEASLMQTGNASFEANKHVENVGKESALVCGPVSYTERVECLVGDREKHKESEEYRRAAEEEWASREKQLRIQAEEAQRLKKRKKAETLRILDMERRQKQRLEEMRENQKKNEETLSLKEELRSEVRKDLERMERTYTDMASILRALGIPVGGGIYPMPNQVKLAYKKAVLKFHPDRVQTSNVHEQVKAEEIFKFISRLKEKLLPAA